MLRRNRRKLFKLPVGNGSAQAPFSIRPNLIDARKVELKTEKVSLSIDPEYSHLVEAKVIDGQKVLIVPVEDHLEFNGVAVNVNKDKE